MSEPDIDRAATDRGLVLTQHVAAPPESVFDFLVDGAKMLRWMGEAVDMDPRPGGRFRLDVNGKDIASGTVLEVDPPSRVVFSFGWEGSTEVAPGSTTVTFTLTPAPDGTTTVELRHDGLPADRRDEHRGGWDHFLGRLAAEAAQPAA